MKPIPLLSSMLVHMLAVLLMSLLSWAASPYAYIDLVASIRTPDEVVIEFEAFDIEEDDDVPNDMESVLEPTAVEPVLEAIVLEPVVLELAGSGPVSALIDPVAKLKSTAVPKARKFDNRGFGKGSKEGFGTFRGIRVQGGVTLVCDISRSMRQDLPMLLKELRTKFPNAHLIFTGSCAIQISQLDNPYRIPKRIPYGGQYIGSPLKAIVHATTLPPQTVIFNCDLGDGMSYEGIDVLHAAFQKTKKTLSCRSLQHHANATFLELIAETKGTFVLHPVSKNPGRGIQIIPD